MKKIASYFKINLRDSESVRKRKTLNLFLLSLMVFGILLLIFELKNVLLLIFNTTFEEYTFLVVIGIISFFISSFILFLINNVAQKTKIVAYCFIFIVIFIISIIDTLENLIKGRGLLLYSIPIIISSFIFKPKASFITCGLIIILNITYGLLLQYTLDFIPLIAYFTIAFLIWYSTETLESSLKVIQKKNKMIQFSQNVLGHDMKNIFQNFLTGIQTMDSIGKHEKKFDQIIGKAKVIHEKQALKGFNLISNLNIISSLDLEKEFFYKINVLENLRMVIKQIKNACHYINLEISIDNEFEFYYIRANHFINQVFENLLIEAIVDNNNEIVKIFIKITILEKNRQNNVKIEFINNGKGINEDLLKLNLGNNNNNDQDITHLSSREIRFFIVKKILELFNGQILIENRIENNELKGMDISILLPLINDIGK
ncbi:MAG: ATP-binding protein [Promethearchaeota archaeon]